MKYRKKPVVIEAVQWSGSNWHEVYAFAGHNVWPLHPTDDAGEGLGVRTLEGDIKASAGDWIIRGIQGEFYPCKPDIFKDTYEQVEETEE